MTSRCVSVTAVGARVGPTATTTSSLSDAVPGTTDFRSRSGRSPRLTPLSGTTSRTGAWRRLWSGTYAGAVTAAASVGADARSVSGARASRMVRTDRAIAL